jgi:hypothetical protein
LNARDNQLPSLTEILGSVRDRVFNYTPDSLRHAEIARGIQSVYVDRLMDLVDADVPRSTRSRAVAELKKTLEIANSRIKVGSEDAKAHYALLAGEIEKFFDRPMGEGKRSPKPLGPMPGSPIGCSLGG